MESLNCTSWLRRQTSSAPSPVLLKPCCLLPMSFLCTSIRTSYREADSKGWRFRRGYPMHPMSVCGLCERSALSFSACSRLAFFFLTLLRGSYSLSMQPQSKRGEEKKVAPAQESLGRRVAREPALTLLWHQPARAHEVAEEDTGELNTCMLVRAHTPHLRPKCRVVRKGLASPTSVYFGLSQKIRLFFSSHQS